MNISLKINELIKKKYQTADAGGGGGGGCCDDWKLGKGCSSGPFMRAIISLRTSSRSSFLNCCRIVIVISSRSLWKSIRIWSAMSPTRCSNCASTWVEDWDDCLRVIGPRLVYTHFFHYQESVHILQPHLQLHYCPPLAALALPFGSAILNKYVCKLNT